MTRFSIIAILALCSSVFAQSPLPSLNGHVKLGAGTFTVSSRQRITQDGSWVEGTPGKTFIVGNTSDGELIYVQANNVKITGVKLIGGGIYRDGKVNGCIIDDFSITGAINGHNAAITSNSSSGLTVTNGFIDHCDYATWIMGESNVDVESNDVSECGYGIKIDGGGTNRVARHNYIHDCTAIMANEWQGGCANFDMEDNFVERIRLNPTHAGNAHALVNSLPMADSPNGKVLRNVFIGQKPAGDIYHPMAHEVGGGIKGDANNLVLYQDNYINGCNVVFAVTDRNATAHIKFKNNFAANYNQLFQTTASTQQIEYEGSNGASAPPPAGFLSWDAFVAYQRAHAGPHKAGATTPPVITPPATQPTTIPVTQPTTPPVTPPATKPSSTTRPATQPAAGMVAVVPFVKQTGWGPAEIDHSNGEQAAGDGKAITIGGYVFAHGVGVHAAANVQFTAPAAADSFSCSIGIDDETGGKGQVNATVFVNGSSVATFALAGGKAPTSILAPVNPGDVVSLVFDPAGATTSDHCDIGYPVFAIDQEKADRVAELKQMISGLQQQLLAAQAELKSLGG